MSCKLAFCYLDAGGLDYCSEHYNMWWQFKDMMHMWTPTEEDHKLFAVYVLSVNYIQNQIKRERMFG